MKKIIYTILLAFAATLFISESAIAQNAVQDSSFEGGTPSAVWTEASTNFPTPLCSATCGNCGGSCAPHTGDWYLWFGGFQGGSEEGEVTQNVTIPVSANQTNLSFWYFLAIPNGTGTDQMIVTIDSDTLFTSTDGDSLTYGSGYTKIVINAEPYEGGAHILKFWSLTSGNPSVTNFLVDDVTISDGTAVYTDDAEFSHLTIYPTPAFEDLNIELTLATRQTVKIELMTLTGVTVFNRDLENIKSGKLSIDVRDYAPGTYFVKITDDKGSEIKKVTIQ